MAVQENPFVGDILQRFEDRHENRYCCGALTLEGARLAGKITGVVSIVFGFGVGAYSFLSGDYSNISLAFVTPFSGAILLGSILDGEAKDEATRIAARELGIHLD